MGEMAQQAANFQQLASGCECMQSAAQIMGGYDRRRYCRRGNAASPTAV